MVTRVGLAIAVILIGCHRDEPAPAPHVAAKPDLTPIVAHAGPIELVADDGSDHEAISIALYDRLYHGFRAKHPDSPLVTADHFPTGLSTSAWAGINLIVASRNTSWVVDGDPAHGYWIAYDANFNGDLRDDARHPFTRTADGFDFVVHSTETDPDSHRDFPTLQRFRVKAGGLFLQGQVIRRGTIAVGGRTRAFTLGSERGDFQFPASSVLIDLNGDGVAGPDDLGHHQSPEAFYVFEHTLNLGERSYDFAVDLQGDALTLTPRATPLPARATLAVGSPAPDLAGTDMTGQPIQLSALRGHTVLVDFWTPWCGPCRQALPKLADLYRRRHGAGLELLSIVDGEHDEIVKTFHDLLGDQPPPGHEIIEPGNLFSAYRIVSFPSLFIVGPDGNLVCSFCRISDVLAKLDT
jgi:thiol-disulfide isomerase/thioredoxin